MYFSIQRYVCIIHDDFKSFKKLKFQTRYGRNFDNNLKKDKNMLKNFNKFYLSFLYFLLSLKPIYDQEFYEVIKASSKTVYIYIFFSQTGNCYTQDVTICKLYAYYAH